MVDFVPFTHQSAGMFNLLDRFFDDDFFGTAANTLVPCRTDIRDEGTKYVLEAELPGFRKEEIRLNVENDCLTLIAQHKNENERKEQAGNYLYRERRTSGFSRSFDISGINADQISASFENGILCLQLPKKEENKQLPRKITIQ